MGYLIDNLQYANWSPKIFAQMREGGVDAVHVTTAYHEDFRGLVRNLSAWNRRFAEHSDLIVRAVRAGDVRAAHAAGRTAILLGAQSPGPIGDDIDMIEVLHQLGLRFMQLTYNTQSLLGAGCFEDRDSGLTRFGRQAVAEMNRVGLVVDLSHAGPRTALDAIAASARPVAITHANPADWHPMPRNLGPAVLDALFAGGGMLGLSLYPHHLRGGSACTLADFCAMVAGLADRYGAGHIGIGSDLCQDQPDSVVHWMRNGTWNRARDPSDGAGFPPMPAWFRDNRDFGNIRAGLLSAGLGPAAVDGIMGDNWLRFYDESFGPA